MVLYCAINYWLTLSKTNKWCDHFQFFFIKKQQGTLMMFSLFNDHHPQIPSGKHTKNYGKSPFLKGKLTISMAIFNSFLYVYQAGYIPLKPQFCWLNPIKPPCQWPFSIANC